MPPTPAQQFNEAVNRLLRDVQGCTVAVMCSESLWWRCHRWLVADVAVLAQGRDVVHLMHSGKHLPHRPAQGARLRDDGLLVWDGRRDRLADC